LPSILFVLTLLILGQEIFPAMPTKDYLILIASGIIGISFADTIYFSSLNILGAGVSSIVNCLFNPFVIGLAYIFLGERLSVLQFAGAALIIGAIAVTTVRISSSNIPKNTLHLAFFLV